VLGNQDTLYVKTGNVDTVARAYFKGCYVEGDVDFVFGRGTMVFDGCEIRRVSTRRGASASDDALSPSTDVRNPYGILVINSMMTADTTTTSNTVALGRAWDEGQGSNLQTYPPAGATTYPNGQAVIRDSTLGAQVKLATPWLSAATSSRPFNSTDTAAFVANRLYEFNNTGPGAAQ
jgi:pectinesterase